MTRHAPYDEFRNDPAKWTRREASRFALTAKPDRL